MMNKRIYRWMIPVALCWLSVQAQAEQWTTYFAYNKVTQIAMAPDKVYALSDGSLFSVEKKTEKIRIYNRLSGLHSTGITCIHYDEADRQLIIAYGTGKIDILTDKGVKYISELYNKDMTQRKTIYNITIKDRTAYLSTHYGIQTMDLRENKLVDSYWLRPGGEETPVLDVVINKDSIYAFTEDSLFCASLDANLEDYVYWKRELRSGRISPDADKGIRYDDGSSQWYAGNADGIVRYTDSERITYKPQGPLTNVPYSLTTAQNHIWIVPGGRWASQNNNTGVVSHYDGTQWINIPAGAMNSKTGRWPKDFTSVAVDPRDKTHYFITSYGTGLYEFRNDQFVQQYLADGTNTLGASSASDPNNYTRTDYARFDNANRLWLLNAGSVPYQLHCLDTDGQWHGISLKVNNEPRNLPTPGGLILDNRNSRYKWIACARSQKVGLYLMDDRGTPLDDSDDRVQFYNSWIDQYGHPYEPTCIYGIMQDDMGRIWLATELGAAYIDSKTDYFTSNAIILPDVMDETGEDPMTTMAVSALCQSKDGCIWVGTESLGVYVLTPDAKTVNRHYTTDNSTLPANHILSLATDDKENMFIGSSEGLVAYNPNATGINAPLNGTSEEEWDMGRMHQWKLHFSYNSPSELAASKRHIFAVAQGALFSYNRDHGTLEYWNRANGLNGNTISHIAYDAASGYLVIAYEDGRIDLMNDDGDIKQMPDLYMKAGSIDVSINNIAVGSRYVYLAMPFGIIAIEPKKGEVHETYYIGEDATDVNVQFVVEKGDSLYAFSDTRMYSAALKDNLIDYHFWHLSSVSVNQLKQVAVHRDELYTLQQDTLLYRYTGSDWKLVMPDAFQWMHASEGQMLLRAKGLWDIFILTEDEQLQLLNNRFVANDALYSQGEYWAGQTDHGLVRIQSTGNNYVYTSGPNSNIGYSMHAAHGKIYSTIGGRWASQYKYPARINIYDKTYWRTINESQIYDKLRIWEQDAVSIAVDPNDPGHFFAATYGMGVMEFRNYTVYKLHTYDNSTLRPVNNSDDKNYMKYNTRTDGAMMDQDGNLWVLNATKVGQPIHILTPDSVWHKLTVTVNGVSQFFTTPAGIWTDRRSARRKWFFDQRSNPGVFLLDDGGTPFYSFDDKCVKRNMFTDQNNTVISPATFRCFAQDHSDRIWLGTDKGILTIPAEVDFFTSNSCHRIIIPRNDGTGLGDYLLGEEQINCMAVDSGNRIWIGTENSGLYLIEDDTITVAHYTETNSLLPSNMILSIAIEPRTGEVFVGTDRGIASYRGDASEAKEDMTGAYAYPNPVRPDYGGYISITGLMDNTEVNIVDAAGNLVCKTRSHGGTAVWDGRDAYGQRATAGVYTALCNAEEGHAAVKILIIR